MLASDVYDILKEKGVDYLYHANSVTTCCTFLRLGGFASRGLVESLGLPQTPQYTDYADKRHNIWNDIFTDGFDIHDHGLRRNNYGPVLFKLSASILLDLPAGTDVLVTRKNPSQWATTDKIAYRYFLSPEELINGFCYGDYGQHIIFRRKDGFIPFDGSTISLILDNPPEAAYRGVDLFSGAVQKLKSASQERRLSVDIIRRLCKTKCTCFTGERNSYDVTEDKAALF